MSMPASSLRTRPKATVPSAWTERAEDEVETIARHYEELARPFKRAYASGAGSTGAGCYAIDDAADDPDNLLLEVRCVRSLHGGEIVEISLPPWADDDGSRLALDDVCRWRQGRRPRRLATTSRMPIGAVVSSPSRTDGDSSSMPETNPTWGAHRGAFFVYRALQLMFRSGFLAALSLLGSLLAMRARGDAGSAAVEASEPRPLHHPSPPCAREDEGARRRKRISI